MYYAHSNGSDDKKTWQPLREHLVNVAKISKEFLQGFIFQDVAYIQGLLHDAGKYSLAFQERLEGKQVKVDHSTIGAKIAFERYKAIGKLIAYSICGHHGGMPDGIDTGFGGDKSSLSARLEKETESIKDFVSEIELPDMPATKRMNPTGFELAFHTRMLFSALVDADYLDTEKYCTPERTSQRFKWPCINKIVPGFTAYMAEKQALAVNSPINEKRREIFEDCLRAAEDTPGPFTLTVPTGGGKTLSSMAFALKHATGNGLKRVIYAIPFTSIIEQTAAVFREALGEGAVLEHHSNYNFEDTEEGIERLAAENWDAPVVVTTNVQLFESLFSNMPSKCRKLHNLTNSVIILDEVQTLPDGLLKPCLAALKCLCEDYGSTVVLCTATQPTFDKLWPEAVNVKEIVSKPADLYEAFKKVKVHCIGKTDNSALANRLAECRQALCIVNTRRHARTLYKMLHRDESSFHLSALMCPVHRTEILNIIRKRLKDGLECRVVSTQLIEAGVDIDFPVVYRSAAGIDSIAQAAGRCNREGKLKMGNAYVFFPEEGLPKGWFQHMAALGVEIINSGLDPLSPEAVYEFFSRRYSETGRGGLDEQDILRKCQNGLMTLDFPFEQIAREFRFIESNGTQIIIPYDDICKDILKKAEADELPWRYARALQRYTITVYPYELEQLSGKGILKTIRNTFIVLDAGSPAYKNVYDEKTGLNIEPEMEVLVV